MERSQEYALPKELSLPIEDWDQIAAVGTAESYRCLALRLMLIMPQLHRDVTGLRVDVVLVSDFPPFFSSAGLLRVK